MGSLSGNTNTVGPIDGTPIGAPRFRVEVAFDADPFPTYLDQTLAGTPGGYWRLGEASGNFADSSGGSHTATAVGSPTYGVTGALPADADKAITLNGSTQYATTTIAPTTGQLATFSLAAWVKKASAPGALGVIVGAVNSVQLTINTSGNVVFKYYDAVVTNHLVTSATNVCDNAWHYIVGTYDGVRISIYIDGVKDNMFTPSTTLPAGNANNLGIGAFADATSKLAASLDEVAWFPNVALTVDQIYTQYIAKDTSTAAVVWTDLSAKVTDISFQRGRQYELDTIQAGTGTVVFDDFERDLDPQNFSSPYAGKVLPMKPIRVRGGDNLISNPSFETDTSSWTSSNATLARITTDFAVGSASLQVTATGAGAQATFNSFVSGTPIAVKKYTGSMYVKGVGTTIGKTAHLQMNANGGAVGNASFASDDFVLTSSWQRILISGTIDQADRTSALIFVSVPTSTSTETYLVDGVQVVQGDPQIYVDAPVSLFTGYVEAWPNQWEGPSGSSVQVRMTDGFLPLSSATLTGRFVSALSGTQIGTALSMAGWSQTNRSIEAGQHIMVSQPSTAGTDLPAGTLALDVLQAITDSEFGLFFINGSGNAVFQDRSHRFTATLSTVPQAVFGDNDIDPAQLEYIDLLPSLDVTQISNDWQITSDQAASPANTLFTAKDSTSIHKFLRRTTTKTSLVASGSDIQLLANYGLSLTKDAVPRYDSMTFQPILDQTLWTQAMNRELSDLVTVIRHGSAINCYIEQISWTISPPFDAVITWQLSPSSFSVATAFVLDDATKGTLDMGNKLLY